MSLLFLLIVGLQLVRVGAICAMFGQAKPDWLCRVNLSDLCDVVTIALLAAELAVTWW